MLMQWMISGQGQCLSSKPSALSLTDLAWTGSAHFDELHFPLKDLEGIYQYLDTAQQSRDYESQIIMRVMIQFMTIQYMIYTIKKDVLYHSKKLELQLNLWVWPCWYCCAHRRRREVVSPYAFVALSFHLRPKTCQGDPPAGRHKAWADPLWHPS